MGAASLASEQRGMPGQRRILARAHTGQTSDHLRRRFLHGGSWHQGCGRPLSESAPPGASGLGNSCVGYDWLGHRPGADGDEEGLCARLPGGPRGAGLLPERHRRPATSPGRLCRTGPGGARPWQLVRAQQLYDQSLVSSLLGIAGPVFEGLLFLRAGGLPRCYLGTATGTPKSLSGLDSVPGGTACGGHVSVPARAGTQLRIPRCSRQAGSALAGAGCAAA